MKESQNIEFKQSWRDEYIKWISGFANAQGGQLYIGKDDKGKVVDLPNAPRLLEEIPNKVRDLLGIMVDVNLKKTGKKNYLEICVEPYPYPISHKGRYYYRSGSTRQELKGMALDRFLLKKQGKHWDGVPVPGLKVQELENSALEQFRNAASKSKRLDRTILKETDTNLLEKLLLFEGAYLKRGTSLLFHPEPDKYITGAYIKIGRFKSDSDLLFQNEIHGNLFSQVDQAMDILLTKYLIADISYQRLQRIEQYPYPEDALREVLLNAVIHKDYSGGSPIQISVYDDKLYIWNDGQLPENWTIKNLLEKHPSKPFNPLIANAFFRAGLIEAWGRGIEKVFIECKQHGIGKPVFDFQHTGLMVQFLASKKKSDDGLGDRLGNRLGDGASERIAKLVHENPKISITEMSKKLSISTTAVEKTLKKMRESGVISRIGKPKSGHWKLTEKFLKER